jgi:Ca2+/H+ antiporter
MFTTLALLFIIVAAFALVFWGAERLGMPPQVRVVALVILGLFALFLLYQMVATHSLTQPLKSIS